MITLIEDVLSSEQLEMIHHDLEHATFVDGQLTAGIYAKTVKNNKQVQGDTDIAQTIRTIIHDALCANPLFMAIARPKVIRPFLLSRYDVGMSYGWHTDNAVMGEYPATRSDLSLTVFLSSPETYEGGELQIDTGLGEQSFKLASGSIIVYPSVFLHRVTEVTKGTRLVAVTWVQSMIREASHREVLFDLDTVRRSLFEKQGKTVEFDLLSKTHANLLRQWVDL